MLAYCLAGAEILGIPVLAGNAQETYLDLLLQVLDQGLFVGAEAQLRDEETMGGLHVAEVVAEARRLVPAENACEFVFGEGWSFGFLGRGLLLEVGVMALGLDVLVEGIGRVEFPPA